MLIKLLFSIFTGLGLLGDSTFSQTLWEMDPLEVRELINKKVMTIEADQPKVHSVLDIDIGLNNRNTPARIYYPSSKENLPLVLLIHGGGWVAGNIETHDNMARYLCRNGHVVVLSIGYDNSPENKFPGPLEQCYDALLLAFEEADVLHIDSSKISIIGDSAGGNMAAALCLLARDRQGPTINLQILLNPSPDLRECLQIKNQFASLS